MNIAEEIITIKQNTVKMADMIDTLDALTITGEASGESININDSAEMPFKAFNLYGKTKQLQSTGKNMIPFPYYDGMRKEINGVTFVVNDDGSILVNGTATADTSFYLYRDYNNPSTLPLPVGTYSINSFSKSSGMIFQATIRYNNVTQSIYKQSKGNISITSDMPDATTTSIRILVYKDRTINNEIIYPMFSSGSDFPEYEPYTNGIPSPSIELPQPMISPGGGGSVYVGVSNEDGIDTQGVTFDTPNGLSGVPVYPLDSGDPYIGFIRYEDAIDIDGKDWICDEVDVAKGVYIRRVGEYTVDIDRVIDDGNSYIAICKTPKFALSPYPGGLWELGGCVNNHHWHDVFAITNIDENGKEVDPFVAISSLDENIYSQLSPEEFKARYNGTKMLLIRAEPIETPLSTEHDKPYTYKPTTNISNDAGVHMVVKYYGDPELR